MSAMQRARVLYVEDDRFWRRRAEEHLARQGLDVTAVASAEEGLTSLSSHGKGPPRDAVVLLDLHLRHGRMQGEDFLKELRSRWPKNPPPVIVLSIEDDFSTILPLAARYMHTTPRVLFDYQNKRYGFSDSPDSVADSYERLAHAVHLVLLEHAEAGPRFVPPFLIGISPEIRAVFRQVRMFAGAGGGEAEVAVLVTGDTGTGKELVARLLHFFSQRSDGPFIAVNCAAIPETLLESELFGSVKGAFTGATERQGLFEAARGGTLFLDEIGEMTLPLQAKLLRVLQDGRIRRVGDTRERDVRTRVVTATNQSLGRMVREGRFREDLYYRLAMLGIELPPLKGRTQDIELLANSFIIKHLPVAPTVRDVDIRRVREILTAQPYPGNVRELEGVIMKALILAGGSEDGRMGADHIRAALAGRPDSGQEPGSLRGDVEERLGELADLVLADIVAGRRPPLTLPEIDDEFSELSMAYQLTRAIERRMRRLGERRRGPTDEEARAWFGYSGASSYRRWLAATRKSRGSGGNG
jgi:two-component system response regulator AtoC